MKLLKSKQAEEGDMRKAVKRSVPKVRRAELSPEVRDRYIAHQKSGECLCGGAECGEKASPIGRGLSDKCHNRFKGRKESVMKSEGVEAATGFDIFAQENGAIFPPRFTVNTFTELHADWEAKRQAIEQGAAK